MHRNGLVQAVDVPAGRGVVTWRYRPPGFRVGFALPVGATALIIAMLVSGLFLPRAARPRARTPDPGEPPRLHEPRFPEPMVRNR